MTPDTTSNRGSTTGQRSVGALRPITTSGEEPAASDDVRARILDAAEICLERYGLQKTTIEDVAKASGVSRATVYRYVDGGKDEIVL